MIGPEWNIPNKKGITMFMVGAVIGFLYFFAMFLQDTEALIFSATASGDETLRSLSCPEILTPNEIGTVRAKLYNRTDQVIYRTVRTHISRGFFSFKNEYTDHYFLQPGEVMELSWTVRPSDAAWGYVALVKVNVLEQDPYPSYIGACGIAWLDVPYLQGWHVSLFFWLTSTVLMAAGFWRYRSANQPMASRKWKIAKNLLVIMVTVLLAMSTLLIELWYLELIFFIFTIILLAESTFSFSQS